MYFRGYPGIFAKISPAVNAFLIIGYGENVLEVSGFFGKDLDRDHSSV